jgi:predicted lipoprotein with Yx(FWY)xxD motif
MAALTFGPTVHLAEMKRALRLTAVTAVVVAAAICVVACGGSKKKHETVGSATATTATSTAGGSAAATTGKQKGKSGHAAAPSPGNPASKPGPHAKDVAVMTSRFGNVLNAPGGHALYVFTQDKPGGPSTCYGECATKWPPFIVKTTPRARDAAKQRLLGTVKRNDGKLQATYAGRPLYFYFAEKDPGEILCQGVAEFGGTWYVVAPGGKPVKKA